MSGIYIVAPNTPALSRVSDAAPKSSVPAKRKAPTKPTGVYTLPPQPAKSRFVSNLAGVSMKAPGNAGNVHATARSTSFSERPTTSVAPAPPPSDFASVGRDDSLKVVEDLKMGPYEHKPLPDDPKWETLEPHSGIRLSKRELSHDDFSDMLRGRYYISPSTLYSVVRLSASRNSYDVPVEGDWVTIAVVAERGPIKMTMSRGGDRGGDDKDEPDPSKYNPTKKPSADKDKDKEKGKEKERKPTGKKFLSLKLVDFGTRTSESANAQIRGDALLSLLLFESDSYSVQTDNAGARTRIFRGGSRGAFEDSSRLRTGAVVAILDPRILKPMSTFRDARPDQANNLLALTPESNESIVVLGYSRDLGLCTARKKDGKACGSWCDKRTSEVCDYHVQQAVQSRRAHRPEFTAGTSGMATFAQRQGQSRKPAFDPVRKVGLLPRDEKPVRGGETYIVGGHTVSALAPTLDFVHEKIGRAREARKARKRADDTLELLLDRDLENAHEDVGRDMVRNALKVLGRNKEGGKEKGKEKEKRDEKDEERDVQRERTARKVFDAATVKALGFDPLLLSAKNKAKPVDDIEAGRKVAQLTASASSRTISLSRRPGEKIRSGIVKPAAGLSNDGDSDDDLEITPSKADDSSEPVPRTGDDDLEIELSHPAAQADDIEVGLAISDDDDEQPIGRPSKKRRLSIPEDEYDEEPLEFPDSDDN
ncbi:hypothetical protein AURDEDRAFT_168016 [Auricularia subglabra TFB-10046 SS5]|nr:hypothetical protein AURDEDRAFT_168016 [Auricularia subglabra TFB-10046 SS5]